MNPEDWKEATKFLWAVLLLPVGMVWKKVNGAVQKEDFKEYAQDIKQVIKDHAENDDKNFDRQRQTMLDIFEKLETQGKGIERIETTLTFLKPRQ